MARLYISSTFRDLTEERGAAWSALRDARHVGEGMESYLACDARPLDACLSSLATCQGYIGLIGRRYGYVPDGQGGKSITQLEYEEAGRLGLPRFIFFVEYHDASNTEPDVEALRALLKREHLTSEARSLEQLKSLIFAMAVREFGEGTKVPPLLPYLCDRSEQIQEFRQGFEQSYGANGDARPLLVIVHGDEREAHSKFVERLRKDVMPKLWKPPGGRNTAIKQHLLAWPAPWRGVLGRERLLGSLALTLDVSATPEAVIARLCGTPALCVIETHVLTADCRRDGVNILEDFVNFFQSLPFGVTPPNLVITLSLKYARPGWLPFLGHARVNAAMEATSLQIAERVAPAIRTVALSKLESVLQNHADQWVKLEETQRFCEGRNLEPHVRKIFEEAGGPNGVPMEQLASKLSLLLQEGRNREEAKQ